MRALIFLVVLFQIHSVTNLVAQNPCIRHYTTFDGLPSNIVYHVYQDSHKFIWFATDAGAVRFDGSQFTIYTKKDGLNSGNIRKFKEDSSGRLWITNRNGSLNFFFDNTIFNASNAPFLDSLKPVTAFSDFFEDDDHTIYFYNLVWETFALDLNNNVRKSGKVSDILLKKFTWNDVVNLYTIRKDSAGDYLVWTSRAVFKFKKLFEDPVQVYSQNDRLRHASATRNGYFYIVAHESMMYKFKDEFVADSIPIPITTEYSVQKNNYMLWDHDEFFWYRTWDKGVYCFKDDRIVRHFDIKQASMIIQDHENNIWISSTKDGVYKISPNLTSYRHFENDLFQNKGVRSIDSDAGGGIWFTNGQSVYFHKNDEFYQMDPGKENVSFNVIYHLKKDHVIVGERASDYFSIMRVKPNPVTKKIDYEKIISSRKFLRSINGISINRKEDKMNSFHYFDFFCLDPERLFVLEDKYYHNVGSGIYLTYYNNQDDLIINAARNYILKGDTVVYATELAFFDNKTIARHLNLNDSTELFLIDSDALYLKCHDKFYNLTSSFGSLDNVDIRYVTYDEPVLYMASFRNIYSCENPINVVSGKSVHLKYLDIPFRNIYHILASNDTLYVGSDDGLTVIPKTIVDINVNDPPIPYMKSILVNDEATDLSGQEIVMTGNNKIKFIFSSINFSASPVIYSYKLEGSDQDWSAGTETMIVYQNLPKGNYIFKLRISKPFSTWSEPIEYRIRINAALWQHPLFFTALALLIATLIMVTITRRNNLRMERRMIDHQLVTLEQKALQSMMNPHFIFNSLGSIQNYILQKNTSKAGLYLSQFARLIRQNLNAIKAAMINLDEEADRLKNYLDLEKMRLRNKFEYRIAMEESIEAQDTFIPSMMIQPLVENAIWHGITPLDENGMVSVYFQKESENSLKIIVEDNGIGMKKSAEYSTSNQDHLHLTLDLNRKRLELLGKKFNVATGIEFSEAFPDRQNPGTRVEIVVPFSYSEVID
ncbi:MAG: histidine kinase [Bacteroidales bacterium]|nr:histidine kinase [Bacteroidales bacterium]